MPRPRSNPILDRVRTLTLQTAATLRKELENLEEERKRVTASFTEAASHIMETLRHLGHSENGKIAAKKTPGRKKRRIRRSAEELEREAQAIIQLIRDKGDQGAKGNDIRKQHPKVGPDIKGFVQKHGRQKLKTAGTKATMRYFAR